MTERLARLNEALAGRYRIESELGSGGMAIVYLGEDTKHDRQVAVKVLRPDIAAAIGKDRFLREIQIAARLTHPHILPLHDSGEADGFLYYVMPFVPGESLRGRLDIAGKLPVDEGLRILRDIVDALAYAHGVGIVHRDIKPENLLLLGGHALVADFGVAKIVGDVAEPSSHTTPGMAVGTPRYMAPEQLSGSPDIDHRADIYSFGLLAHEVLFGTVPFERASAKKAEGTSTGGRTLPDGVDRLVSKCFATRADERWQSADELLVAIEALRNTDVHLAVTQDHKLMEATFSLNESVCRKLNRATLDPRVIGDAMQYLDNRASSDVLVLYLHGMGLDHRQFETHLRTSPYRGIAPTLYGLAPDARLRIALSLDDHITLLRELLRDVLERLQPAIVVLVGFSSGADLGFQLLARTADEPLPVDGFLPLDCNLNLGTSFVTRVLAKISADHPEAMLADLQSLSADAATLHEWIVIHDYLVRVLEKFHADIGALKKLAADVAGPLERTKATVFVDWYRTVSALVPHVRCLFSDTDMYRGTVQRLKLDNLDTGMLGEHYRDDSFVTEPNTNHFDLVEPSRLGRQVDEMVSTIRQEAGTAIRDI